MSMLAVFLVPTGLIALWAGFSDFNEERKFLARSNETEGTITGLIGAKHSHNPIGGQLNPTVTAIQMATGTSSEKEQSNFAGAFLRVEYEVGDYIYTVRSRQNFNNIPKSGRVKVQYNPNKPQDAIVERFYGGPEKFFQMIGGVTLIIAPFIYDFFFG